MLPLCCRAEVGLTPRVRNDDFGADDSPEDDNSVQLAWDLSMH
jgi:hypothetical protein